MTRLLTFGSYDCPHAGHAAFLRRCERFADEVVVAVRSDAMFEQLRGHPPVFTWAERAGAIDALGYTVIESTERGEELIERLRPQVLAIGSDWARKDWLARLGVDQDVLDIMRTTLIYVPYTPGISASEIKRRLSGLVRSQVPATAGGATA